MSRSNGMSKLARIMQIGRFCEQEKISTSEGMERCAETEYRLGKIRGRRREFLANMGTVAAMGVLASTGLGRRALAVPLPPGLNVGIIGAGMAGLTCADTLRAAGVDATIYEARSRVGGRVFSMSGIFPGQVAEGGAEAINTQQMTMKNYAVEFGLATEDLNKAAADGDWIWHLDGQYIPEPVLVDEFRDLMDIMRSDLSQLSAEVTADSFTEFDAMMDHTSLAEYLDSRGAAHNIRKALDVVYVTEYGREIHEQSVLNFVYYTSMDKRSKFTPLGIWSDERFHVIGGNQKIPIALSERLNRPIEFETQLRAVRKSSDGLIELDLDQGGSLYTAVHDAVVLAIPFSVLRGLHLDPNLGIPANQQNAIDNLVYGNNTKMHVGFSSPYWETLNGNGTAYADLPNHQLSWEVNPINATANNMVVVDYGGGDRGANLNPNLTNLETKRFLGDLDTIFPGARDAAIRTSTGPQETFLSDLHHWPSEEFSMGSYTSNHPGYFTTMAGVEGRQVDNLYFAGEHTDSFYEWQGYMEGGANSGIRAADEILSDFQIIGGG